MSLISAIVLLSVGLAFVLVQLVRSQGADGSKPQKAGAKPKTESLSGIGWWPLHDSGTDKAGEHDAFLQGGATWAKGPGGGALRLDGAKGYAATRARLKTAGEDHSVAARVRLAPTGEKMKGFFTAVSQDGKRGSTFYLQYSGPDRNFAFSHPGARTVAEKAEQPLPGRWYHLTGTYSQKDRRARIYVDGKLAGSGETLSKAKPTGYVALGRAKFKGTAADYWRGSISDVHIYDRELTPREVSSLASGEPED